MNTSSGLCVCAAFIFSIAAVIIGISPTASAEWEFATQPIHYSIRYFEPVDIEGDGIWELALQVGKNSDSVGVYSPLQQQWIDGPHHLPIQGNNWGCGDFDGDGDITYIYRSGLAIRHFDPLTMTDTILFTVNFTPHILQVWGKTEIGEPIVNLCRYAEEGECHDEWCMSFWTRKTSHWLRYSIVTGTFIDSLNGTIARGIAGFYYHGTMNPFLCVFDFDYSYSDSDMMPEWCECGYSISLLSKQPSVVHEIPLFHQGQLGGWPSCWPWVDIHGMALGWDDSWGGLGLFYQLWNIEHDWSIGAKVTPINGKIDPSTAPNWSIQTDRKSYSGITCFQTQDDSSIVLCLPVSGKSLWEIRDPNTGALIDSIPGLPPADIRTAPILEADKLDLYYFRDSTLYILERPGMPTGILAEDEEESVPKTFTLHQNYPNPFNASTIIEFELAKPGLVKLEIYNILGKRVAILLDEYRPAGTHRISWEGTGPDGMDLVSGIYFARLAVDGSTQTRKMTLLK